MSEWTEISPPHKGVQDAGQVSMSFPRSNRAGLVFINFGRNFCQHYGLVPGRDRCNIFMHQNGRRLRVTVHPSAKFNMQKNSRGAARVSMTAPEGPLKVFNQKIPAIRVDFEVQATFPLALVIDLPDWFHDPAAAQRIRKAPPPPRSKLVPPPRVKVAAAARPASLTAHLMGDPPPGRSAFDKRRDAPKAGS